MKDLLDKLSSYNIFNYLLPGVVFTIGLSKISSFDLIQKDVFIGAFIYYFIGLVVSRIGSLFIEPFLKWIKFLKFSEYKKFIEVSKLDPKIELFSEVNNMFRTLCSLFFLLLLVKLYDYFLHELPFFVNNGKVLLIFLLFLLFLFSYRKQTKFITKRIESK